MVLLVIFSCFGVGVLDVFVFAGAAARYLVVFHRGYWFFFV
jgi:hypothetical protein